jgi:hypothetical protein
MHERRTKRSTDREVATQYLLEALASATLGRGVALLDEKGRLLAGAGSSREMWAVARAVQGRSPSARGAGFGCAWIETQTECLRLAAVGLERNARELGCAAEAVGRILEAHAA